VYDDKILAEIQTELSLAENSRSSGFEGRARVCARRAAGIAIAESRYLVEKFGSS